MSRDNATHCECSTGTCPLSGQRTPMCVCVFAHASALCVRGAWRTHCIDIRTSDIVHCWMLNKIQPGSIAITARARISIRRLCILRRRRAAGRHKPYYCYRRGQPPGVYDYCPHHTGCPAPAGVPSSHNWSFSDTRCWTFKTWDTGCWPSYTGDTGCWPFYTGDTGCWPFYTGDTGCRYFYPWDRICVIL